MSYRKSNKFFFFFYGIKMFFFHSYLSMLIFLLQKNKKKFQNCKQRSDELLITIDAWNGFTNQNIFNHIKLNFQYIFFSLVFHSFVEWRNGTHVNYLWTEYFLWICCFFFFIIDKISVILAGNWMMMMKFLNNIRFGENE